MADGSHSRRYEGSPGSHYSSTPRFSGATGRVHEASSIHHDAFAASASSPGAGHDQIASILARLGKVERRLDMVQVPQHLGDPVPDVDIAARRSLLVPAMQGPARGHDEPHWAAASQSGNTPIFDDRYQQTHLEIMETLSLRRNLSRPENPPFGMWWTYTVEETLLWPILDYKGSVNVSLDVIMLDSHGSDDGEDDEDENAADREDHEVAHRGRGWSVPGEARMYATPRPTRSGLDDGTVVPELIESFLRNVYTKSPILDPSRLRAQAEYLIENGLGWDAKSCQVLLACALGAISYPWDNSELAGYAHRKPSLGQYDMAREYFQAAEKRLGPLFTRSSLVSVQCLFMAGTYFSYIQKPLAAWRLLNAASIGCRTYISKRMARQSVGFGSMSAPSMEQRLCWSCFKAEREIACEFGMETSALNVIAYSASLPTPPNGHASAVNQSPETISQWDGLMPPTPTAAPRESYEDESWYFFLTDIMLRKLEMRIDTYFQDKRREAYRRAGSSAETFFSSLLEALQEFDYQLTVYYDSLPPAMRFPLDDMTPCPNELRQYLRWRFLSVRHDICLPALYILIHNDVSRWNRGLVEGLIALANACLRLDVVLLKTAGMTYRHHGTWLVLRKGVRSGLILVAARRLQAQRRPELATLQVPSDEACKAGAQELMRGLEYWAVEARDCTTYSEILSNLHEEFRTWPIQQGIGPIAAST